MEKLTKEDALRSVQEWLDRPSGTEGAPRVLVMPEHTVEKDAYFVVRCQSEEYVKSGDPLLGLAGSAPIIVNRVNGNLYVTGTAHPVEYYMAEYEAGRIRREGKMPFQAIYKIVKNRVDRHHKGCLVDTGRTIEEEDYYVIFYDSEKYLVYGDPHPGMTDNAPYIADKDTGDLFPTGTEYPLRHYMDEYEAGRLKKI